jgi:hypothetical protein
MLALHASYIAQFQAFQDQYHAIESPPCLN